MSPWNESFFVFGITLTFVISSPTLPKAYILNLDHCKIPEVPLLNDNILPEWNIPFKSKCEQSKRISFINGTKLQLFKDDTNFTINGRIIRNCCWREISRPLDLVSDKYLLTPCKSIKEDDKIDVTDMEYLMVNCTHSDSNHNNSKPHFEFHYRIPLTHAQLKAKLKFWDKKPEKPISVKFLLLDSISRSLGLRSMPNTLSYLKDKLDFVDFKGYHALGEPTIHNYIPMMLGIPTNHKSWNKKQPNFEGKWDYEPFIWQNFSQLNYVTMDTEDMAYWHTFHFNGRTGFTKRQMDFNTRPYFLIQEEFAPMTKFTIKYSNKVIGYKALNCVDGKNVWDFILDYTYEFLIQFQNVPTFSISWWGWPNHDFLPATQKFDEPFLDFFKKIELNKEIMENTIIILMGDHGFRWSNYSETKEGLLERNLPLFYIRLPESFKKQYPIHTRNLVTNAQRVTTHLDLFQTLAHLHKLMTPLVTGIEVTSNASYGYSNANYGISLFEEIPITRNCADAHIPKKFCGCNYPLWDEPFNFSLYKKEPVVEGLNSLANSQNKSQI